MKQLQFPSPPLVSAATSYSVAAGVPLVSLVVQLQLRPAIYGVPFILFFFAVAIVSWVGGIGPGVAAIVLSAALANLFFILPYGHFSTTLNDVFITAIFVVVSLVITLLNGSLRARYVELGNLKSREQQALARAHEAEKRRSEESFQLLVEGVVDYAIFQLDPSGMIVTWNSGAQRIKGYTAEEIVGQNFSRFYPPEDQERMKPQRELDQAQKEGRVEDEGWRLRRDGSRFWANVVITPLHDAGGKLLGFTKITRDLTEKRRAEEERQRLREERVRREAAEEARSWAERLAERTARLQALTAAFAAALTPDEVGETVLTEVNAAVHAQTAGVWLIGSPRDSFQLAASRGFSAEALAKFKTLLLDEPAPVADAVRMKQPVWLFSRAEYAEKYPQLEAARTTGEIAIACIPLVVGDRVLGALSFSFSHQREIDEDGRAFLLAAGSHCAQALDRARLYEAAHKARSNSDFLAKASSALAESLDFHSRLQSVVRLAVPRFADWAAIDMVGEKNSIQRVAVAHVDPEKERLGWDLFRKYPPQWEDPAGAGHVLRTGQVEFAEEIPDSLLVEVISDPELLQIIRALNLRSSILVPMKARGRTLGVITFVLAEGDRRYSKSDVELAEELGLRSAVAIDNARLYRDSLEASRLKDEFLSTLSHELRTPLTAILGWARIIGGPHVSDEKRTRAVEIIARNARAQAQLIDDMLDISRIITGKMRLDVQSIELGEVIEAAVDTVRPAAETKLIRIQTVMDPKAGPIMGDPDRLQQVVWNLLTNAIKFTSKGGRVLIQLLRVNSHVEIEVSDTGEGIAPDFVHHVFERFRQADASASRPYGGLGLGLAIARHLVELHGGTIEARSEGLGKGATFRVKLPQVAVRSAQAEDPHHEHPTLSRSKPHLVRSPELSGLRILVVDDQADSRELVKEVLEQCSADVTCVGGVAQAIAAMDQASWDVLLSDLGMPDEDGYSFIMKVRNRPQTEGGSIPAVAITAYARIEDRTRALRSGFDAHLAKPIDPTELVEVVAALVRRGRGASLSS